MADRGCCPSECVAYCESLCVIGLSVSLSVCPCVCQFVHLSVCQRLSVCPLVCVFFPDPHSSQEQIYLDGAVS